jgi:hypothetical protein
MNILDKKDLISAAPTSYGFRVPRNPWRKSFVGHQGLIDDCAHTKSDKNGVKRTCHEMENSAWGFAEHLVL